MTYSQIWNNSENEAEILYLEEQIKVVQKEIKRAKAENFRKYWIKQIASWLNWKRS